MNTPSSKECFELNDTKYVYENEVCIHKKFETIAREKGSNIAVFTSSRKYTYQQINVASNKLANKLLSHNVKIEDFILTYMDRSPELIASIFAILKAGAVYVPTTDALPEDRIRSIIDDTKASIILTTKGYGKELEGVSVSYIYVDDILSDLSNENVESPNVDVHSQNLAYAIFTSGTTGKPKGVLIEHHSVLNRIGWMHRKYIIDETDILIQKTPLTFDVSIWELFWWSFTGASLFIPEKHTEKNPEKLIQVIHDFKISVIHFVPSMFLAYLCYLKEIENENKTESLKWIFCSGEALLENMVKDFHEYNSLNKNYTQLVNLYGPTEATVDVTYYNCMEHTDGEVPIGKPIDNTSIYIIDENATILPQGSEGELVIGGVNLARAYLNREELTKQKFINLQLGSESVRVYKTGDLAYINEDNNIIYKGRIDTQIKLRGFRIELAEIESVLLNFQGVTGSACVVNDEGKETAHLVAFVVLEGNADEQEIKQFLSKKLPRYMIPSRIMQIKELPLSLSGKLDRKKLLDFLCNTPSDKAESDCVKVTNVQKKVTEIWKKLLQKDSIDKNANFFDIGGNSLLLVQMTILIKKELQVDIDVISLMQYTTIKLLTDFLKKEYF